jgi:4-amino-4-deoxy-L-arabinose transferase-like glycosyltransferase
MRLHLPYLHIAFLAALCLPYCINLGTSSIWDANEAFYAETPREMLESGDYLAPRFNFEPRAQKPPLTYWAILASYKLFGISEFAVRLPIALAAIGVLLFSYGIARMLFNPRAALIAAAVTATVARIFILARRLPIDILLMFFLMGTLFFLVRAILGRKTHSWALAYLFAGLGFLTKGPIALLIPGAACLLWALWGRRLKFGETHPVMGVAILILVTLPWYAAIFLAHGWAYIEPFFLRDNIGRFASDILGPSRGPLYYFPVAATDFFPWSILALWAVYLLWIFRKALQPLKSLAFGLPLIWCLCVFFLFSLSKNKQEYYIAPIYPVAAIILSGVLDKTIKRSGTRDSPLTNRNYGISAEAIELDPPWIAKSSWWFWAYSILALLIFLLSLLAAYFIRSFMPDMRLMLRYAPSLVLIAASLILAWSLARRKLATCFWVLTVSLWTVYLMCALMYLPELERYRPVKRFCGLIEAQMRAPDETGYFRTALPSMVYYLRRPIFEEYDAEEMKRRLQSENRIFCILAEKDYNYFADNADLEIYILDRNPRFSVRLGTLLNAGYFAGEELLLISNRPDFQSKSSEDRSKS